MAVTLWKAEYHHFAFLDLVMGSQSSRSFTFLDASAIVLDEDSMNKTINIVIVQLNEKTHEKTQISFSEFKCK
jgi:hypothetical protein